MSGLYFTSHLNNAPNEVNAWCVGVTGLICVHQWPLITKNGVFVINFTIPIEPVPMGRPRLGRYGVFTPPKSVKFRTLLQRLSKPHAPSELLMGPLVVKLDFYFAIKKSYAKKTHTHHTKKPDLDNTTKAVLDSFNQLFWHDDAQVVELHLRKYYDWTHEGPRIVVTVCTL